MNENEFEYKGKTYVAKIMATSLCSGCAFHDKDDEFCRNLPVSCMPKLRSDGELVIFKEKQQ